MALLTNIRFLRLLFALLVLTIFLASCRSRKEITVVKKDLPKSEINNTLLNKYAIQLGVSSKELTNVKMYQFVDDWYSVPYKYAGFDKSGIDCSGLACKLYESVYSKKIARSSKDIYLSCEEVDKNELQEGDFVFFKIESKNVSHVGIYLTNNKFVHASTKRGVIINDLDEPYYKKYFYKGGRLKKV